MSEKKQVIHVKDLVIQADHVYIERGKQQHNQHHPRHDHHEDSNSFEEQQHEHEKKDQGRRGPFELF